MSEEIKEPAEEEFDDEPKPKKAEVVVSPELVVSEQILSSLNRVHRRTLMT